MCTPTGSSPAGARSRWRRRVGAHEAHLLRQRLDAIDLGDEVECLVRFRVLVLLEELPSRVSDAAGARAAAGLRDRVVASVFIDDESALRRAEDLRRDLTMREGPYL
jgi:hypothetical protein